MDAEEAEPEVAKTEENTTSAEQESKPETVEAAEPKAAEFSLNSNIEKLKFLTLMMKAVFSMHISMSKNCG